MWLVISWATTPDGSGTLTGIFGPFATKAAAMAWAKKQGTRPFGSDVFRVTRPTDPAVRDSWGTADAGDAA